MKWTAVRAQALLQFLLPPSSWLPHSVVRTDCKNLAFVMEMVKLEGRILEKLTIRHHTALLHRTMNTACYMCMYINMLQLYMFFYTPKQVLYNTVAGTGLLSIMY